MEESFSFLKWRGFGRGLYICNTKIIKPLKLPCKTSSQIAFARLQVYFNKCLIVSNNDNKTATTVFCVVLYFLLLREKKT